MLRSIARWLGWSRKRETGSVPFLSSTPEESYEEVVIRSSDGQEVDYRAKYIDYLETELVRVRDERDALKAELFKRFGIGQTQEPNITEQRDLKPVSSMAPSWSQTRFRLEQKRRKEAEALKHKESTG